MSWWAYVTQTSGTDSPRAMHSATGIDGPNYSRWKSGHVPKADLVAQFARAYGRPVLEAFVAAGFLTEAEAKVRPAARVDFTKLTNDELLRIVRDRMSAQDPDHGTPIADDPDTGPTPIRPKGPTPIRPAPHEGVPVAASKPTKRDESESDWAGS